MRQCSVQQPVHCPGAITAPVPRAITDRIGRPVKFVKKFEKVVDKLAIANYNVDMKLAKANQPVKADAKRAFLHQQRQLDSLKRI